jgi:hypothetical protein
MAYLDALETRADATMATLYWWRRDAACPATPLPQRLESLAERAAPGPRLIELPGNRLRANAEARRTSAAATTPAATAALDPDLLAALRQERRHATFAVATGLIATAAPAIAAIYAVAAHGGGVALGFALAGMGSAAFALYHALRWRLLLRSDELPQAAI